MKTEIQFTQKSDLYKSFSSFDLQSGHRRGDVRDFMTKLKRPAPTARKDDVTGKVIDCAGRIIELANAGAIVPGRRVGETTLAAQLKVSRATMRSALDYLEAVGLMERKPRSGTFLKQISLRDYCEVMDIRAELEALAAKSAAVRVEKKELQDLEKLADSVDILNQRRLDGETQVIPKLIEVDLQFHLAVADLSGNRRLVSTLRQQRLIESTFSLASQPLPVRLRRDRPIPSHRDIVDALATGDPDRAALVIRQHIARTKELGVGIYGMDNT